VNNELFLVTALVLQTAKANNVTLSGGLKYNVPSKNLSVDGALLSSIGAAPSQGLTSYALEAISGADNFNDDGVTIRDLFDAIVSVTRTVTPSCTFPIPYPYPPRVYSIY